MKKSNPKASVVEEPGPSTSNQATPLLEMDGQSLGSKKQVESVVTDIPHIVSKEICEEISSLRVIYGTVKADLKRISLLI